MFTWIKTLFADPSGIADDGRLAAFLLALGYLFFSGWNLIVEHRPFDPQQYGTGAGTLFLGIGAFFGIRKGN